MYKIASIVKNDCANSLTGFAMSIYFQGCSHRCKGCFSPQTWKWENGDDYTFEELTELIKKSRHKNISLLGGDPFYPKNREGTVKLIDWIKENTDKKVYVWSGYDKAILDELMDTTKIDYLIDGKFTLAKRDLTLKLRGSTNQNVYKNGVIYEEGC